MRAGLGLHIIACAMLLVLAACGGGGGGANGAVVAPPPPAPPVNRAPLASAGAPQNAFRTETVTLNGSATDADGDAVTYAWTMTSRPDGSAAVLQGATTAKPSFRADQSGTYILSLVVSDGQLSTSATTTVLVTQHAGDLSAASSAGLSAILDSRAGAPATFELKWWDMHSDAYRIEIQNADGSFTPIETIVGPKHNLHVRWRRPFVGSAIYRVIAVREGREIELQREGGDTRITTSAPPLQIVTDKTGQLTNPTQLSIPSAPVGAEVSWTVDEDTFQSLGVGNPLAWNVFRASGLHLLSAQLRLAGGAVIKFARQVEVFSNQFPLGLTTVLRGSTYHIFAYTSSPFPISKVEAFMNGVAVQTRTARNTCGVLDCFQNVPTQYEFTFPAQAVSLGPIPTVEIYATNSVGAVSSLSVQLPTLFTPVVQVTPASGAFVAGTLQLQGNYNNLAGTPITVQAFLGDRKFLETTASAFSGALDLTGIPLGNHTLTVLAGREAVQRSIIVAPGALAHLPLFQVDDDAALLAAEGDLVLFRKPNRSVIVRNVVASTEVLLQPILTEVGDLILTPDWVYGAGRSSDGSCNSADICIYRWSTLTGQAQNLSNLDPNFPPSAQANQRSAPKLEGNFLVWQNHVRPSVAAARPFTIYNTATQTFVAHTPVGVVQGDFAVGAMINAPYLVYFASQSLAAGAPTDLHWWTPGLGPFIVTSLPALSQGRKVLLDSGTIAYTYAASASQFESTLALTPAPALGGGTAPKILSNAAVEVFHRGGVTAWRDFAGFGGEDKALLQQAATSLSTAACVRSPARAASGYFVYCKNDGVYVWSAATGISTLKIQGGPFPTVITGNWLYFKSGEGVYRVPLN